MNTFIVILLVFLTACSALSVESEEPSKNINEGVEIMNEKIYDSAPPMQLINSKEYVAKIHTNLGDITVDLFKDTAPNAVNNFVFLSRDNYYDDVIFHRVISGFMIQGGDPSGTGHGDRGRYPGYKFLDELNSPQNYTKGIVAMANSGPDSNGSQFFIMHKDYKLPYQYVIFGLVVDGLDIVDAIADTATNEADRPLEDITILDIQIEER